MARDITVTFADGTTHTYQGAPDTVTPDQVQTRAEKQFAKTVKAIDGGRSAQKETPQATEKPADPTGSFGQNVAAGVGKFVSDIGTGGAQWINDLAVGARNLAPESVRNALDAVDRRFNVQSPEATQAQMRADVAETRKRDAALMNTWGGNIGYAGGGMLAAPLMPAAGTIGGAAVVGGATGALMPSTSTEDRIQQTLMGGLSGAGGQAAVKGLARVVRPNTSQAVKTLMSEGVTPTPGQVLGGGFKRAEEALTSVPVIGDAIKMGQARAIEDVNRAAFNRALAPLGQKLPKGVSGREAVEHTYDALGRAYDKVLPMLNTQADNVFAGDVQTVRQMVANGAIDPNARKAFERILNNDVMGKFQGQASITGQTLKQIESDLTNQIKRLGQSTDADQRLVSDALKEVQDSLRGLVSRTNPKHAAELKRINEGYANFKRVQRAASSLGAEDGVFNPAQLQNAVKALDKSKDKARFAEGNALMQDLAEPAKAVIGNKVPDSGTPIRTLMALLAGGGMGTVGGAPAIAGMVAAPAMYTPMGQKTLAALLAKRPAGADQAANLVRLTGPYVAGGSAAMATQQ